MNYLSREERSEFLKPFHTSYEQNPYSDDNYYDIPNTKENRAKVERIEKSYGIYSVRYTIPEKSIEDGGPITLTLETSYRIGD